VTVLSQKRARVEQALEAQAKESKALKVAAQRLQVGVSRMLHGTCHLAAVGSCRHFHRQQPGPGHLINVLSAVVPDVTKQTRLS
jgi:hypothetical protein